MVIAQLWRIHHQLFEHVARYDTALVRITLLWLLTVVFLPFPTELIGHRTDRGTTTRYIGTLLLGSLCLTVSAEWVGRHPGLQRITDDEGTATPAREPAGRPASSWRSPWWWRPLPKIGMLALLLLVLAPSLDNLLGRVLPDTRRAPA